MTIVLCTTNYKYNQIVHQRLDGNIAIILGMGIVKLSQSISGFRLIHCVWIPTVGWMAHMEVRLSVTHCAPL